MSRDTKMQIFAVFLLILGWTVVFTLSWGWFSLVVFLISMVISICGLLGVWE